MSTVIFGNLMSCFIQSIIENAAEQIFRSGQESSHKLAGGRSEKVLDAVGTEKGPSESMVQPEKSITFCWEIKQRNAKSE